MAIVGVVVNAVLIPSLTREFLSLKRRHFPHRFVHGHALNHVLTEVKGAEVLQMARHASRNKRRRSLLLPRPFQDHDVSPRIVKGRSMERPAHWVASVTSVRPAMRKAPMARLRRPAMILGPDRVLTLDLSSW
jgi:hypothetical protein